MKKLVSLSDIKKKAINLISKEKYFNLPIEKTPLIQNLGDFTAIQAKDQGVIF